MSERVGKRRFRLDYFLRGLTLAALAVAFLPPTSAHTIPVQTFPAAGSHLATAPQEVWADFSNLLDPTTIKLSVLNDRLQPVESGSVSVHAAHGAVPLSPGLPDGGYLVKWDLYAAGDGHRTSGTWTFTVGNATAKLGARLASASVVVTAAPWMVTASKATAFLALSLVCGSLATRLYVLGRARASMELPLVRLEQTGALLLAASLGALLLVQASTFGQGTWRYATTTEYGRGVLLRICLAMALVAVSWSGRFLDGAWRWVAPGLAAVSLAVFGVYSHTASALGPRLVGAAVDAVHMAAVTTWVGGLACLAILLMSHRAQAAELVEASRRFSRLATACIGALGMTGLVMLAGALGWNPLAWGAALGTTYGRLLALKVLLAFAMLGLGALNRYIFLARFTANTAKQELTSARRVFRTNVVREALVGIGVIALAAAVTGLAPSAVASAPDIFTAVGVRKACPAEKEEEKILCYTDALKIVQTVAGPLPAFDVLEDLGNADHHLAAALHNIGHELGELAFSMYGTIQDTLAHCSMKMSRGCIDGATTAFLRGSPKLDAATITGICQTGNWLWNYTCIHSVGHGVMQATHYSLNRSLELCDALVESNRVFCHEAVFMEYSMAYTGRLINHGLAEIEDPIPRHLSDPYYPCDVVSEPYAKACWPYQDQIILFLNGGDYRKAFVTCSKAPSYSMTCVEAIGELLAEESYRNPRSASEDCGKATSRAFQAACISGFVAWTLQNSDNPSDGLAVCRGITPGEKTICYGSMGGQLTRMFPPAEVARICAQSEPGYGKVCLAYAQRAHA
jgi:copper transport protein